MPPDCEPIRYRPQIGPGAALLWRFCLSPTCVGGASDARWVLPLEPEVRRTDALGGAMPLGRRLTIPAARGAWDKSRAGVSPTILRMVPATPA